MIIIENAVSTHTASKQWHHSPPEKMLRLTFRHWLCSTHYTAVWINEKNLCNQSSLYENYGRFLLQIEAITCVLQNRHFSWWAKMNGIQRRPLVGPWRMYCTYCSVPKSISRDEVTSNSKIINPIALVVTSYTCLKASGS